MNAFASGFPILTLLTVLPLVGAAIALFAGKHARGVALSLRWFVLSWPLSFGSVFPPME